MKLLRNIEEETQNVNIKILKILAPITMVYGFRLRQKFAHNRCRIIKNVNAVFLIIFNEILMTNF